MTKGVSETLSLPFCLYHWNGITRTVPGTRVQTTPTTFISPKQSAQQKYFQLQLLSPQRRREGCSVRVINRGNQATNRTENPPREPCWATRFLWIILPFLIPNGGFFITTDHSIRLLLTLIPQFWIRFNMVWILSSRAYKDFHHQWQNQSKPVQITELDLSPKDPIFAHSVEENKAQSICLNLFQT